MRDLNIAFWNLQNLFDSETSKIAADLEFTTEEGWNEEAVSKKIDALVDVIALMFDGKGPDLLGICEIENEALTQRLVSRMRERMGRNDYTFAQDESPDIRGIDCGLIYSDDIFELAGDSKGHLVHFRYPTRDIFEVPLRLKETGSEMTVFVNHWPSRRNGAKESEAFRITVAARLGNLADNILKLPRDEIVNAQDLDALLPQMTERWNRNILIMGDLNDDPFNNSVLETLRATNNIDQIEEDISVPSDDRDMAPGKKKRKSANARYLGKQADFYNYSWKFLGQSGVGTIHYSSGVNGRSKQVFDQLITSRALYLGLSGLKLDEQSVDIFTPAIMCSNTRITDSTPKHMVRPKAFDRKSHKGISDHFPVTGVIRGVPD